MRSAGQGGLCAICGVESDTGLHWRCSARVLDFGVPGMPPLEADMTTPTLCDNCNTLHRVVEAYRDNQTFAERAWCAGSAADALRLMGWKAHPELARALARRKEAACSRT